jgi:organic radical activating enzyme
VAIAKSVEAQYFDDVVPRIFKNKVQVWITSKCNYSCTFCMLRKRKILNTSEYPDCISKETIDQLFNIMSKKNDVVVISGGECTLYPDMCQYICDKCRETNRISIIYSNGWWGDNLNMIERMKNHIKPNYIALSFNDQMNLNRIEHILEEFKDEKVFTRIYFNMLIKHYPDKNKLPDIFRRVGYTKILSENTPTDYPIICNMDGIRLMPNGTVEPYCNADCSKKICKFGKISDYNSTDEIKKLKPTKGSCILKTDKYGIIMLSICRLILGVRYLCLVTGTLWKWKQKIKQLFTKEESEAKLNHFSS